VPAVFDPSMPESPESSVDAAGRGWFHSALPAVSAAVIHLTEFTVVAGVISFLRSCALRVPLPGSTREREVQSCTR